MKFPYVPFEFAPGTTADESLVYRPVVPIILRGPKATFRRLGLVDTGADFTLLPLWMAEAAGIQLDSASALPVGGVESSMLMAYPAPVDFELRRKGQSLRWTATAHFAQQDYVLLGNVGFLEYFVAKFDWSARSLELSANGRLASPPTA